MTHKVKLDTVNQNAARSNIANQPILVVTQYIQFRKFVHD